MITFKSCPICDSHRITEYHQAGIAPHVIYEIMPGVKVEAGIISYLEKSGRAAETRAFVPFRAGRAQALV